MGRMARRCLISTMVVAALGVALVGCVSCFAFQCGIVRLTGRQWVVVHMGDGLLRLFWVSSQVDRELAVSPNRRFVRLHTDDWGPPALSAGGTRPAVYGISLARRGQVAPFGLQWKRPIVPSAGSSAAVHSSMVRAPAWVPVVLLLAYPTLAYIRGPIQTRRRRRRNECVRCGYSLVGLPEPRCPECGRPIEPLTPV